MNGYTMNQERTFYADNNVLITNTRAVLFGSTFALANITSVRSWKSNKSPLSLVMGILLIVTGIALAILTAVISGSVGCGGSMVLLGAPLVGVYFLQNDWYYVKIGTAGGEVDAVMSKNATYVNALVEALNNGIIHRG
jgi:hypothetical protein